MLRRRHYERARGILSQQRLPRKRAKGQRHHVVAFVIVVAFGRNPEPTMYSGHVART